jgi:hypothetical protein
MIDHPSNEKPATLVIECRPDQKRAYLRASGRRPLGAWALEVLDAAAIPTPQMPDKYILGEGPDGELYGMRLATPRFLVWLREQDDGTLEGRDVMWFERPPEDAVAIARWMRELGDTVAGILADGGPIPD